MIFERVTKRSKFYGLKSNPNNVCDRWFQRLKVRGIFQAKDEGL